MAIPTTRAEFADYCLRALGAPVLQINVADEQVEDRIDEALYLFQQVHTDAVSKVYVTHEVTGTQLHFANGSITGNFANNEVLHIAGNTTNGLTFTVTDNVVHTTNATSNTDYIVGFYNNDQKRFSNGDIIVGTTSSANGTFVRHVLGDMDNKYYEVAESLIAVTRVFNPFDTRMSADILFDGQSQFNIALLGSFTNNSLIPYVMGRQYQQLLNDTLRGRPMHRFQRHQNRLYFDGNWRTTFRPGYFIIAEGYAVIDPDEFPNIWSDRWLQRYAIALLKRQWGMNLSKYSGIQMPGNVSFDGRSMLTEANQEVKDLEEELRSTHEGPCEFFVG